jgi:ABC-type lipoprotein release transport system permease subunit
MLVFIAWRNIWRNRIRSALTISALAGGLVMVILYASLLEGMSRQMVRHATEISSGHFQIHRQAFIDNQDIYATLPWSYLEHIETAFPTIHVTPRLYAAGLASTHETSTGVLIKAIDPRREKQVTSVLSHIRLGEAQFGVAKTTPSGLIRYNLVVGAQLAKNMKLEPGSELVLVTQASDGSIGNAIYRVAGILKPLEPGFDRMGVLMSVQAYQELLYLKDGFHEAVFKLNNIDLLDKKQSDMDAQLLRLRKKQPLDALGGAAVVRNWQTLNPAISDMLRLSGSMLLLMGLIIMSLASLGMLNTMLMAIHERTYEFGILLSIGMKRARLLLMVLMESLFLALISTLIGVFFGYLLALYLEIYGIDFSASMPDGYDWGGIMFEPIMNGYLELRHIVQASILTIAVSLIAALVPSWRTIRLKPAEVLR